jgi:uncharacterized protein involved in exopolysaccharide biosynthesis
MKSNWAKRWGIILIFLGFAIGIPGFWLLIGHAHYEATTRIKIELEMPDGPPIESRQNVRTYDPYFIQIVFETIQSQAVLSNVVEMLHLDMEWGERYVNGRKLEIAEAVDLLKQSLHLSVISNTFLIEISVISEDPAEAAKIANAIAEAYRDDRLEKKRQLINRGIDALNEVLGYEKQKIKAAQDEVDRLKNELNPPDVGSEKPDSKFQPYWEAKQKLERLEHFRDIVSQKISQMDDRNRSMSSPTSIVDRAQLPTSPIGPNRTLGKALLGVGGLLILCGFVVFVRNWRKPDAAES